MKHFEIKFKNVKTLYYPQTRWGVCVGRKWPPDQEFETLDL